VTYEHKAYGRKHRRIRQMLLPQAIGKPCPICKLPMLASDALDLGHSSHALKLAGLPGDRMEHAACNRGDFEYRAATTPPPPTSPHLPQPSRDW
jgi:hypothetical protein